MLAPDVRFEGWTAEDWQRFTSLWRPRAAAGADATRPRGGVIVVHEGGVIRKALHTRRGRIDVPSAWPAPLGALADANHASWAVALERGALDELMERFGARARRGDDLVAQALSLVTIVGQMIDEGALESWPKRLRGVPIPTPTMVRRALDALCPEGHAIALGLFEGGELWTAFVARRGPRGIDIIAGPDELRGGMGVLSGDFRRDYRHLARVVSARYAPLAFGCFSDVDTFRELQVDPHPGAWGKAVAVRDVVLAPIPPGVQLALGADGLRYALRAARSVSERLDPLGRFDPVVSRAKGLASAVLGHPGISDALGFDPLAVLRVLLRR